MFNLLPYSFVSYFLLSSFFPLCFLSTLALTAVLSCSPARGRKKLLKNLLPILIGIKLKVAVLLTLAYLAIAFIAKKALLVSLVSSAISAFAVIQKLLSQGPQYPHHEVQGTYVVPHGGGWEGAVGGGYGHADFGSHPSPVAHTLAYGTQKSSRK